jgi:hypothetical protein
MVIYDVSCCQRDVDGAENDVTSTTSSSGSVLDDIIYDVSTEPPML